MYESELVASSLSAQRPLSLASEGHVFLSRPPTPTRDGGVREVVWWLLLSRLSFTLTEYMISGARRGGFEARRSASAGPRTRLLSGFSDLCRAPAGARRGESWPSTPHMYTNASCRLSYPPATAVYGRPPSVDRRLQSYVSCRRDSFLLVLADARGTGELYGS